MRLKWLAVSVPFLVSPVEHVSVPKEAIGKRPPRAPGSGLGLTAELQPENHRDLNPKLLNPRSPNPKPLNPTQVANYLQAGTSLGWTGAQARTAGRRTAVSRSSRVLLWASLNQEHSDSLRLKTPKVESHSFCPKGPRLQLLSLQTDAPTQTH